MRQRGTHFPTNGLVVPSYGAIDTEDDALLWTFWGRKAFKLVWL
jgi:hypothetical protein